jgi:hypothetical protein
MATTLAPGRKAGVPVDSYSNYVGGVERPRPPLPWYKQKPPPHIRVQHIGTETTLDALFSALVPPSMTRGSKNVARLFPDFEAVERDYYKTTGIFPIQHVVAISKDVYRANPWVGASLYKAFKESRDKAYEMYRHQSENMHRMFMVPWITQHFLEMQALLGDDWFPYGLKRNHKPLDTFLRLRTGVVETAVQAGGFVSAGNTRRLRSGVQREEGTHVSHELGGAAAFAPAKGGSSQDMIRQMYRDAAAMVLRR